MEDTGRTILIVVAFAVILVALICCVVAAAFFFLAFTSALAAPCPTPQQIQHVLPRSQLPPGFIPGGS